MTSLDRTEARHAPRAWRVSVLSAILACINAALALIAPVATRADPLRPAEIDCATVTDSAHKALADVGRKTIEQSWLKSGSGWLAAYEIGAAEKNPLLPNAPSPAASSTIRGYVFVSGWSCTITPSADQHQALLKIKATTFRFNESGAGWTNAAPNGLVLSLLGKLTNDVWATEPVGADASIFPQGMTLKRAQPPHLPPHERWPERPCRAPKLWTGERCAVPAIAPEGSAPAAPAAR